MQQSKLILYDLFPWLELYVFWTNIFYFKLAKILNIPMHAGGASLCLDIEFLNFTTAEISTFLTTLFMVMREEEECIAVEWI